MEKNKQKNKIIYNKRILEICHNILKKHWWLYSIVIVFPLIWFDIILPYFGKDFSFIDENNSLTTTGIIITIVVMVLVVFISLFYDSYLKYKEENNIDIITGNLNFLQEIIKNVDKICDEKLSSIKRRIIDEKELGKEKASIISNPNNQLKRIIDGITECLVNLLNTDEINFKFKDFLITIAYNFPNDNTDWQWVESNGDKDMELEELLKPDCLSTFNYLLKTNKPYYFNNYKEIAKNNGQYVYTPLDELSAESGEIVGSIFCHRYKIKKGNSVYVDAMLSITTQKKRFSVGNEDVCDKVRDNMVSIVKDYFGKRISIELSLLYLEYLKNNEVNANNDSCNIEEQKN